jgi:hypothetical protein
MKSPHFVRLLLAVALGCSAPPIESSGDPAGGEGGTSGTAGAAGLAKKDAGFTVSFPDGGGSDGPRAGDDDTRSCAGEIHEGKLVPLDLLFLVDTSGSMEESGGAKSKWMSMREAIESFVRDPQSEGLGVGLATFPVQLRPCTKDAECGGGKEFCGQKGACGAPEVLETNEAACYTVSPMCVDGSPCRRMGLCARTGLRCTNVGAACPGGMADNPCTARPRFCTDLRGATCPSMLYETPLVPIAELPGGRPALETALGAIVPEGSTPTTSAAQGALAHLRSRAASGRKQALVLATDGMPAFCAPNTVETAAAVLADARAGNPGITTHVIGVFSAAQLTRARPALEQLATAGGTGAPFILTTGGDLTQKLVEAINQIRGAAVSCQLAIPIPAAGSLDYAKVNVRVTTPTGREDVPYVGSADRCDPDRGGWHYEIDPATGTPTQVLLCEATCRKTKVTVGLSIDLRFGCQTITIK